MSDLPTTDRVPDEVVDAALTASRVMVAIAASSLGQYNDVVSLLQFRTLVLLAGHGPMRPGDLSAALSSEASTVTRLCTRLLVKGLISRQRDEEGDRREVIIRLTVKGRRLVDRVTERRRLELARIISQVPETHRGRLLEAFLVFGEAAGELPDAEWPGSWQM